MGSRSALFQRYPALAPLEKQFVHELDLSGLDELTRERIIRTSQRRQRPLTLGRALRTLPRRDRERLEGWLEVLAGTLDGSEDGNPDWESVLQAGMSRYSLYEWATGLGLQWATQLCLRDRDGSTLPVNVADLVSYVPERGLRDPWWYSADLQTNCVDFLVERAREAQRFTRELPEMRARWSEPPQTILQPLWRSALEQLERRLVEGPPTLPPDSAQILSDPPTLVVEALGHEVMVPLEGESLLVDYPHHLAMAGLIGLLTYLQSPSDQLLEVIGTPHWERQLDYLSELTTIEPLPEDEDKRLLGWEIANGGRKVRAVQCRWTKTGRLQCRRVDLRELHPALLTEPVDHQVAAMLHCSWGEASAQASMQAVALLAGHPRVLRRHEGTWQRIDVRTGPLTLRIEPEPDGWLTTRFTAGGRPLDEITLQTTLQIHSVGDRIFVEQGDEFIVVFCTAAQACIAFDWIGRASHWPPESLQPLLTRLPDIQRQLPVELAEELRGDVVEGDERPLFRTSFRNEGLIVEARIQPVPDLPSFGVGDGPETLHVLRSGHPACVVRKLTLESAQVRSIAQALGLADRFEQRPFVWAIDDVAASLDVVRGLHEGQHRLEIDGSLPQVALGTSAGLSLNVASKRDWFAVGGQLKTELEDIPLERLLAAVDEGLGYVQVSKTVYVRLEEALTQQLSALGEQRQENGLALNAVHTPLLKALEAAGATVQGGDAWRHLMDQIEQASTLSAGVPPGLSATLRGYQEAGFRWLAALAAWAPGAILADDMGLGKTIQAIALLLHRQSEGPALVVAPTSVVFNWEAELARFAPSLRVVRYAGSDRSSRLKEIDANTVVVCSWGISVRDNEALSQVDWGTLVLDEAQAIKNPKSKRTRATMNLGAGFRLALSGTPVENRIEELWSLFAVTVPGLFGPLNRFVERFGRGGPSARKALARLAAPFMLRRTKREVARDLPERTELRESIELSAEHRALYLRARADALARIEQAPPAKRKFLILSQLTRLRQLACDPRLIDAGTPLRGSKIARLIERLHQVKETGQRALVFSSFVGHLELAKQACQQAQLRVAWLTGAVPAEQREHEVARFQRGEADVFLISLKAGGTGLNLTAASYVFHLDPWWNPAAEDQATDRAHRIGQTNPVTVYRFVASGTIEDQILALHDDKRDLVEALMAGSGSAIPVSAAELMALLADQDAPLPEPEADSSPHAIPEADPHADPEAGPDQPVPSSQAFLEAATHALQTSDLTARSRGAYERALVQFVEWADAKANPVGKLEDALAQYLERAQLGEISASRASKLKAAWRRVGHLANPRRG